MFNETQHIQHSPCAPSSQESREQVRFSALAQQVHASQDTNMTVIQKSTVQSPVPHIKPIPNLCMALQELQQSQGDSCVGYLLDSVKREYAFYSPSGVNEGAQEPWATYSLRQILTGRAGIGWRLRQHDKLKVVANLSSSVLQLYRTPWLDDYWKEDDLFFVRKPRPSQTTIYEYPYVYRKLTQPPGGAALHGQPTKHRVIRNQALYSLGILLIELWYGKTMEQLRLPSDLNCQGTPGEVWCTADRLIANSTRTRCEDAYAAISTAQTWIWRTKISSKRYSMA